ncbi:hypothetical protein ATO8_19239 [Roseivivax marinus]|uniref:Glycosyl transferase family 2 n=1 Tax=Roseivivax marinus TaxID=1379903 RepID=W4HDZ4_9RHOB|nr:hypothetical protein [Roseivivax marinus]ETW10987.1 hypothetical protein ATO8_19239 [Roseivivax marinus]
MTRGLKLISCIGTALDLPMVPHFVTHYAELGIAPGDMHFILQSTEADAPELAAAEAMLARIGTAPPLRWVAPYTSDTMWAKRRELQRAISEPGLWILNADLDEHYVFPDSLEAVLAHCAELGVNCVQGLMVDRLSPDGALTPVAEAPALARQFPLEADVSLHVFGDRTAARLSASTKILLHRADLLPRRGGHNPNDESAAPVFLAGRPLSAFPQFHDPETRFRFPFLSHHYKWIGSRKPVTERRIRIPGASEGDMRQGQKFLDYVAEHGRMRLEDAALRPAGLASDPVDWRTRMAQLRGEVPETTPRPAPAPLGRLRRLLARS